MRETSRREIVAAEKIPPGALVEYEWLQEWNRSHCQNSQSENWKSSVLRSPEQSTPRLWIYLVFRLHRKNKTPNKRRRLPTQHHGIH
ncbi:uncharacterized protein UV8b_01038 [Ustilaginoidea virens]|uniref:Uncharacterized protein n=1 Tax=Ustilaginoidea virens TaxID=1159556 RepID=A0A8E5HK73_USTVR|nr:uncharacterized protein UV8b_01038 [Ustilaginoidea virens]QUC16797.1 hypothetical protein UV8b_01038 [Ustilaginoidea virens]